TRAEVAGRIIAEVEAGWRTVAGRERRDAAVRQVPQVGGPSVNGEATQAVLEVLRVDGEWCADVQLDGARRVANAAGGVGEQHIGSVGAIVESSGSCLVDLHRDASGLVE